MAAVTAARSLALYDSHTKKPTPAPPESISTATITIQAIPMDWRSPVTTDGRALGSSTWRR